MTLAQETVSLWLFMALMTAIFLYKRPWRRDLSGRVGELMAMRIAEALIALCLLIFVVAFVFAVLNATVWPLRGGQSQRLTGPIFCLP